MTSESKKKIIEQFDFRSFIPELRTMLFCIYDTPSFIKRNKLWDGIRNQPGIAGITLFAAVLFSYFVFDDLWKYMQAFFSGPASIPVEQNNLIGEVGQVGEVIKEEGNRALFSGGTKYLLLIVLELVIFSFSVSTLNILRSENKNPNFSDFVKAEKRMIVVMVRNFFKGLVVLILLNIILGILGVKEFVPFLMFFVYSYFIGFAFLDNYNEQFGSSIKDSERIIRSHVGGTLGLGLFANLLLFIPIVGPFVVPIMGAISGTLFADKLKIEQSDSGMQVNRNVGVAA